MNNAALPPKCLKIRYSFFLITGAFVNKKKMSLFRRKKSGKVFPVKISTMDAELEFSLDYKVMVTIIVGIYSIC